MRTPINRKNTRVTGVPIGQDSPNASGAKNLSSITLRRFSTTQDIGTPTTLLYTYAETIITDISLQRHDGHGT